MCDTVTLNKGSVGSLCRIKTCHPWVQTPQRSMMHPRWPSKRISKSVWLCVTCLSPWNSLDRRSAPIASFYSVADPPVLRDLQHLISDLSPSPGLISKTCAASVVFIQCPMALGFHIISPALVESKQMQTLPFFLEVHNHNQWALQISLCLQYLTHLWLWPAWWYSQYQNLSSSWQ